MLLRFNEMLSEAYRENRAVGSFNFYHLETMKGIVRAAEQLGQPAILSFGQKYLANMSLEETAALARAVSDASPAKLCLHLDHCSDPDLIYRAIRAGFTSVMYDGSRLPFEENVSNTGKVCEFAHACGVSVEAELGSLAAGKSSHEGSPEDREIYTSPDQAAEFVERTGVDALAVSIGTVHGLYRGTPRIRVDILEEINRKLHMPLVLHGGSGTPEEIIRACIRNGIAKINVNTEISDYAVRKTRELLSEESPHLSVVAIRQMEAVEEIVGTYMKRCNCSA